MPHTPSQIDWRELFRDAVRDWHSKKKQVRLEEASQAIQRRLRADGEAAPLDQAERSEMESALYFLSLLSMVQ
jgi:hypothetical protein